MLGTLQAQATLGKSESRESSFENIEELIPLEPLQRLTRCSYSSDQADEVCLKQRRIQGSLLPALII